MTGAVGRIHEGGYRKYTGERLGPSAAVRSVYKQTVQRVLGLRRPARTKILPFLAVIIAYMPALVYVGAVALLPREASDAEFFPQYVEYYGNITMAIVLFVVFTAPEALCPDRRSRVLSLYLAAPLTRTTYLAAKAAAVASVLLLVTTGPVLLLLLGRTLQGVGPDGVTGFLSVLARILGAGVVVSLFYTGVSLGISSLTDRRALASGGALLLIVGSSVVTAVLLVALGWSSAVELLNLFVPPLEAITRIYGEPGEVSAQPTWVVALAVAGWSLGGLGLAWWRYASLRVTR